MRLAALVIATALAWVPSFVALAGTYRLDIEMRGDRYVWAIKSVSVDGGKVGSFHRDPGTGDVTMTVTLPDGTCHGRVRIFFTNSKSIERKAHNVCSEQGMWVR